MYDMIVTTVALTHDELEIVKLALERYQEITVSVGESYTVEGLLDKLIH